MQDLQLTTPALLFPTISLLLLAYTNRYIAISNRIRLLHSTYKNEVNDLILRQIKILKKRIYLIRNMQLFGIGGMFGAAMTMFLFYFGLDGLAQISFAGSLISILVSISLCSYEIYLSNKALMIQISDIEMEIDKS